MTRPVLSFEAAVAGAIGPVAGLTILDIGCGDGAKTRVLAAMGAAATGLEPRAEAVAAARAKGGAVFHHGGVDDASEAIGPPGGFDLALFSLSLHHTPDPAAALAFARRMLRPGGRVAALEPEAHDPSWALTRLIDDEAAVLAAAERAIGAAEGLTRERRLRFAERARATTAAAFLEEMIAVDPARAAARARMAEIAAAFEAAVEPGPDGPSLTYWMRFDVLRAA